MYCVITEAAKRIETGESKTPLSLTLLHVYLLNCKLQLILTKLKATNIKLPNIYFIVANYEHT